MEEVWKKVPIEGRFIYECSNLGNLRSIRKNGIYNLKLFLRKTGYVFCNIATKYYSLHRIIMLTFIGKSDKHVDHIDRNPLNNKLENLRYVTPRENCFNTSFFRTDITEMDKKKRKDLRISLWKKEKMTCECGAIICKGSQERHKKTKKHLMQLKNIEDINNNVDKRKIKYKCECGDITLVQHKARHEKTLKHINFVNLNNNNNI